MESIGEGTVGMEVGMRDKWIYATPTKDDQVIDKYDSQCVFLPHDWRDDVLEDAQAGSTDKDPLGGSTDKERRGQFCSKSNLNWCTFLIYFPLQSKAILTPSHASYITSK